jgi:hypothetical protein
MRESMSEKERNGLSNDEGDCKSGGGTKVSFGVERSSKKKRRTDPSTENDNSPRQPSLGSVRAAVNGALLENLEVNGAGSLLVGERSAS